MVTLIFCCHRFGRSLLVTFVEKLTSLREQGTLTMTKLISVTKSFLARSVDWSLKDLVLFKFTWQRCIQLFLTMICHRVCLATYVDYSLADLVTFKFTWQRCIHKPASMSKHAKRCYRRTRHLPVRLLIIFRSRLKGYPFDWLGICKTELNGVGELSVPDSQLNLK